MSGDEIRRGPHQSLNMMQRTATNLEKWLGIKPKSINHNQVVPGEVEVESTSLPITETQTTDTNNITAEDLTNPEASDSYWEVLAQKRQVTLEESLVENAKLRKSVNELEAQLVKYTQMVEEANSYIGVIKQELLDDSGHDTGIDVNDVSTADETIEGTLDDASSGSDEEYEEDIKN